MNELPEMPKDLSELFNGDRATCEELQRLIKAYALSAVQMERERLAAMCEAMMDPEDDGWDSCLREVAAAIRSPSKEG